jgi:hypothetical protein
MKRIAGFVNTTAIDTYSSYVLYDNPTSLVNFSR